MIASFRVAPLPEIVFGNASVVSLPERIASIGDRFLLVRGRDSLLTSKHWPALRKSLRARDLRWAETVVEGEPSPELVDRAVATHRDGGWRCVVGIGGGSVLDAAKAVAGLLPTGTSVMDHLEDVGRGVPFRGPALPFLAVPTTAGTGSEATKNAVLSRRGPGGFKKSFRHDLLLAKCAVVDPELLSSCPPELIASDGLDALTQLLESFTSVRASPFTDALCRSGLSAVRHGLLPWFEGTGDPAAARSSMAYAALLSGITLAHAGLGVVHGLAQPLGSGFPVPHGVVCGTLLAPATAVNVSALRGRDPESPALARYAEAWSILAGQERQAPLSDEAPDRLVDLLEDWTRRLGLCSLSRYGVGEPDLPKIVGDSRGSSMKSNPIALSDEEIAEIVRARL